MSRLSDDDVLLLKVLLERGLVAAEWVEDLLARTGPPPAGGLASLLVSSGMVADAPALAALQRDLAAAPPGTVVTRLDLADHTLASLADSAGLTDAATLARAREIQHELAGRGQLRDLATILVHGGQLSVGIAVELRRRVAERMYVCFGCGASYIIEPSPRPRRFACRHCRAEIAVRGITPAPGDTTPRPGSSSSSNRFALSSPAGSGRVRTLAPEVGQSARFSFADTLAMEIGARQSAGRTFGPYTLVGELGRGGMGVVYRAVDTRTQGPVALKVLSLGLAATPKQIKRFQREAESAASLDHPGLVRVLESGCFEGHHYMVQELVEGRALDAHLGGGPTETRWAAEVLAAVADAVDHAHRQGVVHRDLKPANILIAADTGAPRVTDFGLARRMDDDVPLTRSGAAIGTPYYMAPEQIEGRRAEIGPAVDIYALGVILYEMLAGRRPFRGATPVELYQKIAGEEPRPPSQVRAGVPDDLDAVCLRCLQKHPSNRYAAAGELAADLRRFLAGERVHARAPGALARFVRRRRRAVVIGASVLGCLVVGASISVGLAAVGSRWASESSAGDLTAVTGPGRATTARNERAEATRKQLLWAERAVERGEPGRARELLAPIIEQEVSPDTTAGALRLRARLRIREDDRAGSLADLDRAIALHDESADARLARAALRRETGELAAARADLERALALAPGEETAIVALGNVLLDQGELARAGEVLAPTETSHPGSLPLLVTRARAASAAGETEAALAELDAAIERAVAAGSAEEEVLLRVGRGQAILERDGPDDPLMAVNELQRAWNRSATAFLAVDDALAALVRAAVHAGAIDRPAVELEQAAVAHPERAMSLRRAVAWMGLFSSELRAARSEEHARWLIERDPDDPVAKIVLGDRAAFARRFVEARPLLEAGLAARPDDALGLHGLCFTDLWQSRWGGVLRLSERLLGPTRPGKLIARWPGMHADVAFWRSNVLRRFDRLDEAEQLMLGMSEGVNRHPDAPRELAQIYLARGELERAEQQALAATESRPSSSYSHWLLGHVRREAGRPADALPAFDAALVRALEPQDTFEAQLSRARALIELGRPVEALAPLDAALAAMPDRESEVRMFRLAALMGAGDAERIRAEERELLASQGPATGHATIGAARIMAGDAAGALDMLEKSAEAGYVNAAFIEQSPSLEPLRDHARWAPLRDRIRANAAAGAPGGIPTAHLGVTGSEALGGGASIDDVGPDTGAERAGLQVGDVIVRFGERSIGTWNELTAAIRAAAPGDEVALGVRRGERELELRATLGGFASGSR